VTTLAVSIIQSSLLKIAFVNGCVLALFNCVVCIISCCSFSWSTEPQQWHNRYPIVL